MIKYYSNQGSLALISYNNYQPVLYFCLAFLLVVIGGFLIYYYIRSMIRNSLELGQALSVWVSIMAIISLIPTIITNINVPIFQALLSVVVIGGIGMVAFSSSN